MLHTEDVCLLTSSSNCGMPAKSIQCSSHGGKSILTTGLSGQGYGHIQAPLVLHWKQKTHRATSVASAHS